MSEEMITAQCKDCGKEKQVYADTGLCESCEGQYVGCVICHRNYSEDELCRHVFWDRSEGWWAGPGADDPCYQKIEEYKEAIVFAVRQIESNVLSDLLAALKNGTLRFCLCGTTFGIDSVEIHGKDGAGESFYHQNIVEDMHGRVYHEWSDDEGCLFENGFHWLMALDEKTPRENTLVIEWIEEIIQAKGEQRDNDHSE